MELTIENLYKEIYDIEYASGEKNSYQEKHGHFEDFAKEIQCRIKELDKKTFNLNDAEDKEILKKILVESDNAVANVGPYFWGIELSKDDWTGYIMGNATFLKALKDYMQNPDNESYFNKLLLNLKYNARGIINRIASTCTQNVSTLVNPEQFDKAVELFIEIGLIKKEDLEKNIIDLEKKGIIVQQKSKTSWFAKNQALMKIINDELGSSVDSFKKAAFVVQARNYINKAKEGGYDENVEKYLEGGVSKSIRERIIIKRNYKVREKCLEHYFSNKEHYHCKICYFDFEEKYGQIGKGYIEVHHIESHTKKSKEVGEHETDPKKDLLPVCSNCHAMLHKQSISIDELKKMIKK